MYFMNIIVIKTNVQKKFRGFSAFLIGNVFGVVIKVDLKYNRQVKSGQEDDEKSQQQKINQLIHWSSKSHNDLFDDQKINYIKFWLSKSSARQSDHDR